MKISSFLKSMLDQGVTIWLDQGQLRYRAPAGKLTQEMRASISERKSELITFLQASASVDESEASVIVASTRNQTIPLSYAQERLWFLNEFQLGNAAYILPGAIRLSGLLQVGVLERVINEIVRRHEVLRTTYVGTAAGPVQEIQAPEWRELPVVDLSALSEAKSEAERLIREESRRPFNLEQGPVVRTTLLRLGEEEHILLYSLHHIASDGWSAGVLNRELETLYRAYSRGEASPLEELPIQYADFAVWQREWLSGEVLTRQLEYWRGQLSGASALVLPTDYARPAVQSYRGAVVPLRLGKELLTGLKELCRAEGLTLFMVLAGAFQLLLGRYSGQREVLLGTPIANRNRREIEGLIGFFVNTLVLRGDLKGDPMVREWLGRVREATLGAYAHQDLPFEQLVQELQPQRDLSRNPLVQVSLELQNMSPDEKAELPGLKLQSATEVGTTTRWDLELHFREARQGLTGWLVYNTDLFREETIARMAMHLERILAAVVRNPGGRLSEIELLSEGERHQLLEEWNETEKEYPQNECIHELFEAQAREHPERVALEYEDKLLTYGELNQRANQLAHYLRSLGVGPEVLVGLCVERSLEMVVGILGILKAGGAYVPLDGSYPLERLAFMVEDAQLSVLVSQRHLEEKLPSQGAIVVYLEDETGVLAGQSVEDLESGAGAEHLAYVMYTSGSTGRPKGVMIEHRGLNNYLNWSSEAYAVAGGQGTMVHSSLSFDLTITGLLPPLVVGQKVRLAPEGSGVEVLARAFKGLKDLSLIKITPAHLEVLKEMLQPEEAQRLCRALVIGGEALLGESLKYWREHAPQTRLINEYGPTETVVGCCVYEVKKEDPAEGAVPIGRPIANTQLYILDGELEPVPVGVAGELYIGGAGLGRGYWGRAELTAERFIPHPHSRQGGERLYRTGDLGRYLADGTIEFLGRADQQVKLRGFRIELGEIESVLARHPQVRECVVVARRSESGGEAQLVAYVVGEVPGRELRLHLQGLLPEYMVPAFFVALEHLPLTPNGKVDRRALPAPDFAPDSISQVMPHTTTEELMAKIWSQTLRVERVGTHGNFFELGGHSLLATQLISRVRDVFGVDVQLGSLFKNPTVASLSKEIEELGVKSSGKLTFPLSRREKNVALPLSYGQEQLWFLDQLNPNGIDYNMPGVLRMRGKQQVGVLERVINEIVRRHEVLRTTYVGTAAGPVQEIHEPEWRELPVVDLSALGELERRSEAEYLIREESRRPFNLEQGPVVRTTLLRLGEEEHVLLYSLHHIASDGWSMGIMVREFEELYAAFSRGESSPLPELPIQYADFALWQRNWLQGEVLDTHIGYWKRQLGGQLATFRLPPDRIELGLSTSSGRVQTFSFAKEISEQIKAFSSNEVTTLFMTLLAGFKALIHSHTGEFDSVVATDVANRSRGEVEGIIGFFVNQLVLRTALSGNPTLREVVHRVRKTCLAAFAHQDLPFNKLVAVLNPERNTNNLPLFQTKFVLQNAPDGSEKDRESESKQERFEIYEFPAKFDLLVNIKDGGEGLHGTVEYKTSLYSDAAIRLLIRDFELTLMIFASQPELPLSNLNEALQQAKRQQIEEEGVVKKMNSEKLRLLRRR